MAEQRGGRPVAASQRPTGGDKAFGGKKQFFRRKKMCRFCVDKIDDINYKEVRLLASFIMSAARSRPAVSRACARLTNAVWRKRSSNRGTSL